MAKLDMEQLQPEIFVAPTGAHKDKSDHCQLPLIIDEIVETAVACFKAGAVGIHAHVRDGAGKHVLDCGLYLELMGELALRVPEMAVQISTESVGLYSPAEQRALVREVKPGLVSIALGEMLVDGDMQAVSRFYHELAEQNIGVQHIVYSPEEFEKLAKLMVLGTLPARDKSVLFVLGRYAENQQSNPEMLEPFLTVLKSLRQADSWQFMVCAFGISEIACLVASAKAGGNCRIGFENNILNADGSVAKDNSARVRALLLELEKA